MDVDPGRWTLVDGQCVDPRGHLEVLVNSDDSLDLRATLVTWLDLVLAGTPPGLKAPTARAAAARRSSKRWSALPRPDAPDRQVSDLL